MSNISVFFFAAAVQCTFYFDFVSLLNILVTEHIFMLRRLCHVKFLQKATGNIINGIICFKIIIIVQKLTLLFHEVHVKPVRTSEEMKSASR